MVTCSEGSFGYALEKLKEGKRLARKGWNGQGMWIALSPGSKGVPAERFWSIANRAYAAERECHTADVLSAITMKLATGEIMMGWTPSQVDMLSEDWEVV